MPALRRHDLDALSNSANLRRARDADRSFHHGVPHPHACEWRRRKAPPGELPTLRASADRDPARQAWAQALDVVDADSAASADDLDPVVRDPLLGGLGPFVRAAAEDDVAPRVWRPYRVGAERPTPIAWACTMCTSMQPDGRIELLRPTGERHLPCFGSVLLPHGPSPLRREETQGLSPHCDPAPWPSPPRP
jgi:hypothetical protein